MYNQFEQEEYKKKRTDERYVDELPSKTPFDRYIIIKNSNNIMTYL